MQYKATSILPLAPNEEDLQALNGEAMKRFSVELNNDNDELSQLIVKMSQIRNRII